MKNIQVIDGAMNATYSIYAIDDDVFDEIFPGEGQDIEFADEAIARLGKRSATRLFARIWKQKLNKPSVVGIHGTLFFELPFKKEFYPNKREADFDKLKFINGRFRLPDGPSDGPRISS